MSGNLIKFTRLGRLLGIPYIETVPILAGASKTNKMVFIKSLDKEFEISKLPGNIYYFNADIDIGTWTNQYLNSCDLRVTVGNSDCAGIIKDGDLLLTCKAEKTGVSEGDAVLISSENLSSSDDFGDSSGILCLRRVRKIKVNDAIEVQTKVKGDAIRDTINVADIRECVLAKYTLDETVRAVTTQPVI